MTETGGAQCPEKRGAAEYAKSRIFRFSASVRNLKTGEIFTERYDKLILSPGAKPVVPEFCRGGDRVYTLRTVEDALALKEACRSGIATAAVIGGGFIGLETAENLTRAGLKVSLFERGGHVLATVDDEKTARQNPSTSKASPQTVLSMHASGDMGESAVMHAPIRAAYSSAEISIVLFLGEFIKRYGQSNPPQLKPRGVYALKQCFDTDIIS